MGRLCRDPELRVTPKGTPICQFALAVNREWKGNGDGDKKTEALFVDVEAWGKAGEAIAKYLTKGRSLFVEGRLKQDEWTDNATQQKRTKIKVVCEAFQFLGDRGSQQDDGQREAGSGSMGHSGAQEGPQRGESQPGAGKAAGDDDFGVQF